MKLPNISAPLSITPLPLRSSTSQASSEPGAVHESLSLMPLPSKSKFVPPPVPVKANPFPGTLMRIGLEVH